MDQDLFQSKYWMRIVLKAAALYNWVWGIWVVLFPNQFFEMAGMEPLNHPMIWQGMGMVIGVYGFGYWWASYNPIRHWPVVAVGMMGKIFGPLGFFINYLTFDAPGGFFLTLITNDFIWWVPFLGILVHVHKSIGWKLVE
ncbi:MAG: alkyl hydroperoxide reductase [Cyclobacteriaceae bacterium]|jgi:small multidrug resistance pump|nr:alkyl hydroperoxide reductase [Cyclobacteriaceae bacterium]